MLNKYGKMSDRSAISLKMRVDLGFISMIGRLITACGIKPIGKWQWLFKAFWLYGAVEPATGESFFLEFSHVDSDCYSLILG